jgi:hypothetical protein
MGINILFSHFSFYSFDAITLEQIRALQTGLKALHFRKQLWNYALIEIRKLES